MYTDKYFESYFIQPEWRRGLIPLPHYYADLMNLSANFCCENSVTRESKTPALCLVCGLMVCSQSHCCETIIGGSVQTECYNLTNTIYRGSQVRRLHKPRSGLWGRRWDLLEDQGVHCSDPQQGHQG